MYELNPKKKWQCSKSFPFQMMICIPSPFSISFFRIFNWILKNTFSHFHTLLPFFSSFMTRHWFSLAHPSKKVIFTMSKRLGENGVSLSAFFFFYPLLFPCLSFISYSCLLTQYSSYTSNSHSFPIENDSPMDFDKRTLCTKQVWITSAPTHRKFFFISRDKKLKHY